MKPGDFDFEEASVRLNCEGGEIYFLVAGHLGVMSLPEQLSLAINEGQFSDSESQLLQEIADPMRLLRYWKSLNKQVEKVRPRNISRV